MFFILKSRIMLVCLVQHALLYRNQKHQRKKNERKSREVKWHAHGVYFSYSQNEKLRQKRDR